MTNINLTPYELKWDTHGCSLSENYIGKDKDGQPKESSRHIGYYGKNYKAVSQALESVVVSEFSKQDQSALQELKDVPTIGREEVETWVKNVMEGGND